MSYQRVRNISILKGFASLTSHRSGVMLTLNNFTPFSNVSIVDFEQVNVGWDLCTPKSK